MRIEKDVQVVRGTSEQVKKQLAKLQRKRNKVIAEAKKRNGFANS